MLTRKADSELEGLGNGRAGQQCIWGWTGTEVKGEGQESSSGQHGGQEQHEF